ncbi:hypothetical protein DSM106972_011740 [Dulcicalothrix desertica PCC 7102]|uniref:Uncharacterized protein n=1 Tax=Dulcicalothrix desertica PCC 7102 TaxID=232991 RepID=A0A433VSR6_9CYAN|nr:hypothetical protein [Dulcicalothrix desertica]RUT09121.1 hypothetical protein DSM106972_011740 [Dulcicalothrix desertica PCC 7102]TWH55127.1 hypothetical protein CAL7102_03230 [Dulcicalothrix desertica PCC 7102]
MIIIKQLLNQVHSIKSIHWFLLKNALQDKFKLSWAIAMHDIPFGRRQERNFIFYPCLPHLYSVLAALSTSSKKPGFSTED